MVCDMPKALHGARSQAPRGQSTVVLYLLDLNAIVIERI